MRSSSFIDGKGSLNEARRAAPPPAPHTTRPTSREGPHADGITLDSTAAGPLSRLYSVEVDLTRSVKRRARRPMVRVGRSYDSGTVAAEPAADGAGAQARATVGPRRERAADDPGIASIARTWKRPRGDGAGGEGQAAAEIEALQQRYKDTHQGRPPTGPFARDPAWLRGMIKGEPRQRDIGEMRSRYSRCEQTCFTLG